MGLCMLLHNTPHLRDRDTLGVDASVLIYVASTESQPCSLIVELSRGHLSGLEFSSKPGTDRLTEHSIPGENRAYSGKKGM